MLQDVATVESLSPNTRAAVAEHAALCKHDLGKYIALQTRWTAPDAPLDERRAAVLADLAQTRRGPDGNSDAVAVWALLRPALFGEIALLDGSTVNLGDDPDVAAIDAAMVEITLLTPTLSTANEREVARAIACATAVAEACQRLHRRARGV